MSALFLVLPFIIEIPVLNTNNSDPDQMPLLSASDQGLHCLQVSILWDTRDKWVKEKYGKEL